MLAQTVTEFSLAHLLHLCQSSPNVKMPASTETINDMGEISNMEEMYGMNEMDKMAELLEIRVS